MMESVFHKSCGTLPVQEGVPDGIPIWESEATKMQRSEILDDPADTFVSYTRTSSMSLNLCPCVSLRAYTLLCDRVASRSVGLFTLNLCRSIRNIQPALSRLIA